MTRALLLFVFVALVGCSSSSDASTCSDGTYTMVLANFDGDCARYPQPKRVQLVGKTTSVTYVMEDGSQLAPAPVCFISYSAGCGVDVECSFYQHIDVFPVGGSSHKGLFARSGAGGLSCSSSADVSWMP